MNLYCGKFFLYHFCVNYHLLYMCLYLPALIYTYRYNDNTMHFCTITVEFTHKDH